MTISNKIAEIVNRRKAFIKEDWEYYNSMDTLPRSILRRSLSESIKNNNSISIISEIKPASPTLGNIRSNIDVKSVAIEMEEAGAVGLSVLTEPYYFYGSYGNLKSALSSTHLPCLMKDFVVDPIQILIASRLGASNVLVINSICNLIEICELILKEGMEPLIEIHEESELKDIEQLIESGIFPSLIGVNNRNLKTLEIDLNSSKQLIPKIRKLCGNNVVIVSESGINSRQDIETLKPSGANAFLIGASIMQSKNIKQKILELRG
ncbi:MAG: indole-3-glycerol-phosphate synthase [Candidatus Lokiarchaeota archaeon]|nr:indole-3-glycerol-phosphate synthase [Candidatus Lokiarchaeota archaeon]